METGLAKSGSSVKLKKYPLNAESRHRHPH